MINEKREHHFIAKVEQTFHSKSVDVKEKRINRFEVIDRAKKSLKISKPSKIKISNNLVEFNLYCFDSLSKDQQFNFEETFCRYELKYKSIVEKLTSNDSCDNIELAALDLFTYKWMSIIRNPYCIRETLSMFGILLKLIPTDPALLEIYKRVEQGEKPQKQWICKHFEITEIDYINWLKILFLALIINTDGSNILESYTRAIFYGKDSSLNIFIFHFSNESTLLSDVGFTSNKSNHHLVYEFPLTDSHFISYAFTNLESFTKKLEIEHKVSLSQVIDYIDNNPKKVKLSKYYDQLPFLRAFNTRMVDKCHKYVFSKSSSPILGND